MSIYHGDFRKDASKVLAAMLESRLKKKTSEKNPQVENHFDETDKVTLRNKIEEETHNESSGHQNKIFLINKPEVSTHAQDRRSYVEKPNNKLTLIRGALQNTTLPEVNDPVCDKCKRNFFR